MDVQFKVKVPDRVVGWTRQLYTRRGRLSFVLGLALSSVVIYAATISKPFNFTDGQVISASQVNSNFDTLYTESNSKETRITSLEAVAWLKGSSGFYTNETKVGVGVTAPAARLDVNGAVKVANDSTTCSTANAGAIRFSTTNGFQGCDGSSWVRLDNVNPSGTSADSAATSCKVLLADYPSTVSGQYWVDPDGGSTSNAFQAWCDMSTDGGGWTIIASHTGSDGEQTLLSNTEVTGSPLAFAHTNLNQAKKMAISAISTETLFKRNTGIWLKMNAAIFDSSLSTANTHTHKAVTLTASNGTTAAAYMGYANFNNASGGDFGISLNPDGGTCNGTTSLGFDHHSAGYYHLNCSCQRQYLYAYSAGVADGDAGYDVNTALGSWAATRDCDSGEGGGLIFYTAMR